MVVYTAARLQHLDPEDAAKVAQFIRVSTTEGQRTGSGNGELPGGFLSIERTGATAKLSSSAADVATAVEEQQAPDVDPTGAGADGGGTGGGAGGGAGGAGAVVPP